MMHLLTPRWRKVIRDMGSNKARTILIVLSIAVGVFAIGAVNGTQNIFLKALNTSYGASNPPSGTMHINREFSDDLVETIDGMREVAIAEGRRSANLRYRMNETDEWQTIELVSAADFTEMEINKVIPKAGVWPPPDKKNGDGNELARMVGGKAG